MSVHGKDQEFKLDNAAGTLTDLSAYLIGSGVDFGQDIEALEATPAGNNSKKRVLGLDDAAFDVEFDYVTALVTHLQGVKRGLTAVGSLSFQYGPGSNVATNVKYTGECYLTKLAIGSPVGLNTVKASFQVTGAVTQSTY